MTATCIIPNNNNNTDSSMNDIMKGHEIITTSSSILSTNSAQSPTIPRRRPLPPPAPAPPALTIPISSSSISSSSSQQQQQHHDKISLEPLLTSDSNTATAVITTSTTLHDVFISLTSPTMVKKKTIQPVNNNDINKTIEFQSNIGTCNTTTTNNVGEKKNLQQPRFLTPTSIQLIRNSLLQQPQNSFKKNIVGRSCHHKSTTVLSTTTVVTNHHHHHSRKMNDSNNNNEITTATTIYKNCHNHQQQHAQLYRTLKRLDTEPIPTKTVTTPNVNNSTSSCSTNPPSLQQQQQRRRKIFGSFWDTTTTTTTDVGDMDKRSITSTSITSGSTNHSTTTRSNSCYGVGSETVERRASTSFLRNSMITPRMKPPAIHVRSKSDGFQYGSVNHVYGTLDNNTYTHNPTIQFTSLPSSMQRLRKSSGGVYPLVQPKSILRRKNKKEEPPTPTPDNENVTVNTPVQTPSKINNTTHNSKVPDDGSSTATDFDRSSSISSSYNSIQSIQNGNVETTTTATVNGNSSNITYKPLVHFDPRITITELIGRDHHRVWYSDCELNRFKYETVVTARAYFAKHPDQIMYYNKPFYDPVTKTMRKRALFNLPVLANITITDEDDDSQCHHPKTKIDTAVATCCGRSITTDANKVTEKTPTTSSDNNLQQVHQQLLSQLAFEDCSKSLSTANIPKCDDISTIRSVLIVDHNQWILDLFVRSVKTMFNCNGTGCSSRNVIVEYAPNVPVAMAKIKDAIEIRQRQPPFDLIIAEQELYSHQLVHPTSSSLCDGTNDSTLSGAELLFHNLPPKYRDQMLLISVTPSPYSNVPASTVTSATTTAKSKTVTTPATLSDLRWNKPPPRMDNHLRMSLIHTLQKKREQYSVNSVNDHQQQVEYTIE